MKKVCVFQWSGGKDSALALYHCLRDPKIEIRLLVTNLNDSANRISMHGVREELLLEQARSLNVPLYQIRLPDMPGMEEYDSEMAKHFAHFRSIGITHVIYGDIFLEDLRQYREVRLKEAGLKSIFPLWKRNTGELIDEFLDLGFQTVITCTEASLKGFCGEIVSHSLLRKLPEDVDVCGENGEFHTFCYDGPIFEFPVSWRKGETVFRALKSPSGDSNETAGFWYSDFILAKN